MEIICLAVYMPSILSVELTKKVQFYDILTHPKWNQFSQGRVWASVSWHSATYGVWVGSEYIGDWGADTLSPWGLYFLRPFHAILPPLVSHFPVCPSSCPWKQFEYSGRVSNTTFLSPWEQKASRLLELSPAAWQKPCSSSIGLKAHLSAVHSSGLPLSLSSSPGKQGMLEGLQLNPQGVNVGFLILRHWLPFSFRAEH